MGPELSELDKQRRTLTWPARSRRYRLTEEIALEEQHLRQALKELERLGVILLEEGQCRVGFPTIVNGRAAYFTWQFGEDNLQYWQFAGDTVRHTIPMRWWQEMNADLECKE